LLINKGDDPTADKALSQTEPVYRFPHRMFQEYLAAQAKLNEPDDIAKLLDNDFARWREVYALISLINSPLATNSCVELICDPDVQPQTEADWRRVVLAGSIWADKLGPDEKVPPTLSKSVARVRKRLTDLLNTPAMLPPAERAEAGRILATLPNPDPVRFVCADPRHAACANLLTPEGLQEYLANGFVDIQPGAFTMQAGSGGAGEARIDQPYRMGKTPVTVAQFAAFVQDGYTDDRFWTPNGLRWRGERTEPIYWQAPRWHIANHPVIGVTWYEAAAFCNWLTGQFKTLKVSETFRVCLPTETEWEFAARGNTGRNYPWKTNGDEAWVDSDERKCNVSETGLERTSAVGLFPDGATPEGVLDMTGNVWEWTGTKYEEDWRKATQPEDMRPYSDEVRDTVVLRGGSWAYSPQYVLGYRDRFDPGNSSDDFGFRVELRAHFSSTP
jgi:formylglycine-generating enzyme required for sulfatase activity